MLHTFLSLFVMTSSVWPSRRVLVNVLDAVNRSQKVGQSCCVNIINVVDMNAEITRDDKWASLEIGLLQDSGKQVTGWMPGL